MTTAGPPFAEFRLGSGVGLIGERAIALVQSDDLQLVDSLWALVDAGAGVAELLDELSSRGLAALGSFALVQREHTSLRLVVRGDGVVVVRRDDGEEAYSGAGVKTWVEQVTEAGSGVTLAMGAGEVARSPYRASSGVVPADAIRWPAAPGLAEAGIELPAERLPSEPPAHDHEPVPPAGASDRPNDDAVPAAVAGASVDPGGASSHAPETSDRTAHDRQPSGVSVHDPGERDDHRYDELWGRTEHRSVKDAAVAAPPGDAPDPAHRPAPAGLISNVPVASPGADTLAYAPTGEGDHDGMTIDVGRLPLLAGSPSPPSPIGGPTVRAMLCSTGHANPPQSPNCRRCGATLAGAPVVIPRPAMGSLVLSTGSVIVLNRPALLGRNPRVEGELDELPQTVRVDVGQALSRSHLMVRIEGWQVLVEDLHSANGTIVTLPGRQPRRLHPRDPFLLEHGAHIDLGGEVSADYDALS